MEIKVGIGILVLEQGNVLLGKRKGSHGSATWGFPGGHLEFGETVNECTKRELFEETGLIALKITRGPWEEIFFPEEGKHYLNIFTFVTLYSGELVNKEPEKNEYWEWFPTNALPTPLFEPIKKISKNQSLNPFLEKKSLLK